MLLAILHSKQLPYKEYHFRHGERHLPYKEMSKTRLFHVKKWPPELTKQPSCLIFNWFLFSKC